VGRKNSVALKFLISLFAAGAVSTVFAAGTLPKCGPDTLAGYISTTANPPATGGCAIGILDYFDFTYHPLSNAPLASSIQVAPLSSGFSFGPVTAPAGQTVQFEIDYDLVIDPAPIIGDDLRLDPPTGNVVVTEYFCNDLGYVFTASCSFHIPPQTSTVGTPVTGFSSSASIAFNPPANRSQQVGILFTLKGGATGASFDGLDSVSVFAAPEPASAGSLFLGLLTLIGGYKLRKQRHR
jgi:hypothetical protein